MLVPFVVLLAQQAPPPDLHRTMAAGDKDAYVMLPPETVCGAQTGQMLWTADGKTLVVHRIANEATPAEAAKLALLPDAKPPRLKHQIVVWNSKTRLARTVFSSSTTEIGEVEAMPGTDRVVFDVTERVQGANGAPDRTAAGIVMLATGSGAMTRLSVASEEDASFDMVRLSPRRPLGALMRFQRQKVSVRFFGVDGKPGPSVLLPGRTSIHFDAQGYPGYVGSTGGGKGPIGFHRLDPLTGQKLSETPFPPRGKAKDGTPILSPMERAIMSPDAGQGDQAPEPALRVLSFVDRGDAKALSIALRVRGGKPEDVGIVSTDGTQPLLSPTNDAVAYVDQGSAMVRLLAPVSREAYDEALANAARREALNKAKQVGLGILMYASDMDDVYPGQDVDLRQRIGPYLKNDRLFDGFTYVFQGGALTDIEKPAETVLGYVPGPGGRAIVYTDGHAKWIPDAP